jgi:hypothetical protein
VSSTNPTIPSSSSVKNIAPWDLCISPLVSTVKFSTVLEFFHLSNFENASREEVIFVHLIYNFISAQATQALHAVTNWRVGYYIPMKPTPNTKAFRNFTAAMQRILTVSKTELLDREKRAKETRKAKRASARASREKG